jgi:hypothetical protein
VVPSQISVVLIPYGKRRFAMTRPLALRDDFDGDLLRQMACGSKHGAQVCRLLSLAAIYDGASRSECQRRRKIRPLGGAKLGHYSRHAGKRREGVARAVLACVRGDFRRSVQAV